VMATAVSSASYAVWALIAAAGLAIWAISRAQPARIARPGDVIGRLATHQVTRVVLVLVVMWLGWHLFAR
jgi:Family of unknown function (DUF6186)